MSCCCGARSRKAAAAKDEKEAMAPEPGIAGVRTDPLPARKSSRVPTSGTVAREVRSLPPESPHFGEFGVKQSDQNSTPPPPSLQDDFTRLCHEAQLQRTNDNLAIYRRFNYLRFQTLLRKQDRLVSIERHLKSLNAEIADIRFRKSMHASDPSRYPSFEEDPEAIRQRESEIEKLLDESAGCLRDYDEAVSSAQATQGIREPTEWETAFASFRRLGYGSRTEMVQDRDELLTLTTADNSILSPAAQFLAKSGELCKSVFTARKTGFLYAMDVANATADLFLPGETGPKQEVNQAIVVVSGLVFVGLLVGPVWLLYYMPIILHPPATGPVSLTILTASTFLVWCILSFMTRAKTQETFSITAAYCAVLIVFVGNLSDKSE